MSREWLETDGLGGFASSTVLLCPTRRYHGLLVAPHGPAQKRHVFLSRFEETFHGGGKELALSIARYRGLFSPLGHLSIESFELAPWPKWTYLFGSATLEREVLMPRGRSAVFVRWRVAGQKSAVTLKLKPLLAFREADALTSENFALDQRIERLPGGIVCQPYRELPAMSLTLSARHEFVADPVWYRGLEYASDLARGYEGHEDQSSPGFFEIELEDGVDVVLAASLDAPIVDPRAEFEAEAARRTAKASKHANGVRGVLELSADAFLYRARGGRPGVIAGYPWFGEWGRDAYIALPGLTLARGDSAGCLAALEGALELLRDGLLPNVFGPTAESSAYNSVDASLWFALAVRRYELAGAHVRDVIARFLPALLEIGERYVKGTSFGIGVDERGLVRAGGLHLNVTWMDARTHEGPVTPREGCAVEVGALWIQLVAYVDYLLRADGRADAARAWSSLRASASDAFRERFWMPGEQRLADVWHDGETDTRLRPNMVIAAALEWSPLTRDERAGIVRAAKAELLTPFGLRTLGPRERDYHGTYAGGVVERDEAYHQGTVWPWLLGFYVEASLRAHGRSSELVHELRTQLDRFDEHLRASGLGHVSEVFDGDPPHRPGGTIAQAWSSAELLRAHALLDGGIGAP